tara:strand:+ start:2123 stop:3112 length:990 start_codon:yes stop_codon:yes gene_type:complete
MDIQQIFSLLKSLTSQTNVRDLISACQSLLADNFEQANLTIFELQSARVEHQKKPCLACLDYEAERKPFLLHEDSFLNKAYKDLDPVFYTDESNIHKAIYPVVLYDKTISHIILVTHKYNDESDQILLLGLMELFCDIFRSTHEKSYDPLTRILNRQAFDQAAAELAYSNGSKEPGKNNFKAIAILDIDRFKNINDIFGHAIGDETLVLFAQTVRAVLRREDLFFRYGGEEFVVFVKNVEPEQAQQILERCRHAIENRRFPQVEKVTVSIGFSDLEEFSHPNENLLKADKALYFIKENGRNKVFSYEELLNKGLLQPVEIKQGDIDFWD